MVIVMTDIYARIAEMRESIKIMLQCIENMPEGEVINHDAKIAAPKRADMKTSMEAIISSLQIFHRRISGTCW